MTARPTEAPVRPKLTAAQVRVLAIIINAQDENKRARVPKVDRSIVLDLLLHGLVSLRANNDGRAALEHHERTETKRR